MISDNELTLFYQSRVRTTNNRWRFGIAKCILPDPALGGVAS